MNFYLFCKPGATLVVKRPDRHWYSRRRHMTTGVPCYSTGSLGWNLCFRIDRWRQVWKRLLWRPDSLAGPDWAQYFLSMWFVSFKGVFQAVSSTGPWDLECQRRCVLDRLHPMDIKMWVRFFHSSVNRKS